MTKCMIKVLPTMLDVFKDDPDKLEFLVEIPQFLALPAISLLRLEKAFIF